MHNLRCEYSNAKTSRCRCTCAGKHHGKQSEIRRTADQMLRKLDAALARTERAEQAQRERELVEGLWA
jgi:hypothetical protein